jgi:2-keto-4-pentenoate hydratase/2-oxohepta-3-ene-1,7-dioic acid hydratase in catechol pathway
MENCPMRLCRIQHRDSSQAAFYGEERIVPVSAALAAFNRQSGPKLDLPAGDDLLDFLPHGAGFAAARRLAEFVAAEPDAVSSDLCLNSSSAKLLVPIPRPNKIFLLAGNYADHIREGGGIAAERAETFPYVFMKPPTTTLTDPGKPIRIPVISPAAIDWELELAVVIGRRLKGVKEAVALDAVAGYTIINDISNRRFRPNPQRKERPKDAFFDWLHGKWHDSFCPCGPCVTSADAIADPQALGMQLRLNGEVRQEASTALQIFPVAAVIEFISSFVTLEPGDMISTGTPAGVGNSTGTYLKPGDRMEGSIAAIGTLTTSVAAE